MGKRTSADHREAGTATHIKVGDTWRPTEQATAGIFDKNGNIQEAIINKIYKVTEPTYGLGTYRGVKDKRHDIGEDTLKQLNNPQKKP